MSVVVVVVVVVQIDTRKGKVLQCATLPTHLQWPSGNKKRSRGGKEGTEGLASTLMYLESVLL